MYFPNMEMDIFSYTDLAESDAYGNSKKGYVYRETIPVDFQASSRRDKLTEAGEILQDTYKIYVDVNVEINPNDIFRDPDGNTYTIIGTPIANNRFSSTKHKKVELQKTNKPIKVVVE
jgi:hypothetical protein